MWRRHCKSTRKAVIKKSMIIKQNIIPSVMTSFIGSETPVVSPEEEMLLNELKTLEDEYADKIGLLAESEAAYESLCANSLKYNPMSYKAGDIEKFRSLVNDTRAKINKLRTQLKLETI